MLKIMFLDTECEKPVSPLDSAAIMSDGPKNGQNNFVILKTARVGSRVEFNKVVSPFLSRRYVNVNYSRIDMLFTAIMSIPALKLPKEI